MSRIFDTSREHFDPLSERNLRRRREAPEQERLTRALDSLENEILPGLKSSAKYLGYLVTWYGEEPWAEVLHEALSSAQDSLAAAQLAQEAARTRRRKITAAGTAQRAGTAGAL